MHPEIQAMGNSTIGIGSDAESPEIIQMGCEKNGKWRESPLGQSQKPMWERTGSGRRSDEEAGTSNIDVERQTTFASRLAPTGLCGVQVSGRCW
jgi:hypothetical protein